MAIRLSHVALRLATGAFTLNSGIGKLHLDEESAAGLQSMAKHALAQFGELPPEKFGKLISFTEIGVGSALLAPFVPSRLAGLALTAFATGLVTMYLRSPGTTESDGIRPTAQGTPLAKDFWLLAIGIALVVDKKRKKAK